MKLIFYFIKKLKGMKKLLLTSVLLVWAFLWGCSSSQNDNKSADNQQLWWEQTDLNNNQDDGMVKKWETVSVDYVGRFEDGTVFDTSIEQVAKDGWIYNETRTYEPLQFQVWAWLMIKWFDEWVVWMKEWETKTITLTPDMAYWERNEAFVQDLPMQVFVDAGISPKVWEQYNFWAWPWTILEVWKDSVKVDLNNPMAWKTLVFDITLIQRIK